MRNRLKGLLALALSLTMVLSMVVTVSATVGPAGSVTIGGQKLDHEKPYLVNGEAVATATDLSYTAYFNHESDTLTLNNASLRPNSGYAIYADGDLTINLIGDNTASPTDSGGIYAVNISGNLTIEGDGTLTAQGQAAGIYASNITIKDGTVNATATYESGAGISAGSVTITGGTVNAGGDKTGISAKNITINSGEVTATATDGEGDGIYSQENVSITGDSTKVTATGGKAGISVSAGEITITGGTVTAGGVDTGGNATSDYGIYITAGTITIGGGAVDAKGKTSGIAAGCYDPENNIYTSGTVIINGGSVTATGSGDNGCGISAYNVTIEKATVTAAGGSNGIAAITSGGTAVISITGDSTKVTANGKNSGIYANSSSGSTIFIDNSTVIAEAGTAGTGIRAESYGKVTIQNNSIVNVGCKIGISAGIVSILESSTVTIETTGDDPLQRKAISCTTLNSANMDQSVSGFKNATWYQWKDNDGQLHVSSDGDAHELTPSLAKATNTLTIEKISSGGGTTNPDVGTPTVPTTPGVGIPTAPTVEKTESADTFDSGIALSVAVTILSATGSAWLAKKRED